MRGGHSPTRACLIAMAALLFNTAAARSTAAETETIGTPAAGAPGTSETTEDMMARQEQHQAGRPERDESQGIRPRYRISRELLPPNAQAPGQDTGGEAPVEPLAPQTLGINFTGATLADTGAFPPDSMGAAGPTQFIVAVNGRIRSFNKTTGIADGVLNVDPDVFFNSVMTPPTANNFTSDPRIRYDRLSGRWFIIIIDVPGQAGLLPNRVLIAVSNTSTITGSTVWTFFQFQHDLASPAGDSNKFADYPTLGIDANALYIGVNVFNTTGLGDFYNTTGFVVRKSSILGAGPIVVTAFRKLMSGSGAGPYTPQGVDNFDPAAAEGYFIGVDGQFYGRLALRRISNPAGTPSISGNVSISTNLTSQPITVRHLGNTGGSNGYLDALDWRLMNACLRNGRLWTAHNIGVNNSGAAVTSGATRNGCRWYELTGIPTGQTPSVVQTGTLSTITGTNTFDERNYWIPSVMVSGQGHMALGCSAAGTNEYANAATVGRLGTDALGTLRTPVLYTTATTAYNPSSDPGGPYGRRWGDYSYTSLDPCDDMTMWTIQEFCNATNSYGVRVVKLLAPPPATPASANPPTVAQGQASVNVTITGTQIDGSGFYDPGAGFACRIGAAVSGGVLVNSVTYTDPTHVTLNISTVSAATGAQTVTVTNPDGQSLTSSSGILTVTSACSPDTLPPTITSCGANASASANASCQAAVPNMLGDVTATDNCTAAGSLTKTQSPTAGTFVGLGNTTVTITVKDAANNSATCQKTFTVNDTTAPSITSCGANASASANASCQAAVPNMLGDVTATDNCTAAGSLTKTQSPTAGTFVGLGNTTVTITVKDAANNSATCQKTFTVNDATAPNITACGANASATAGANCQAPVPNMLGDVTATDNCTPSGSLTKTQSPTAGTFVGLGNTTVTITVKDAANNSVTCQKNFTVSSPDTDGDGVPDCLDDCPNTIPGVTVDSFGCPPTVPADFDGDGDVDADDFDHLKDCRLGPEVPQPDPACQDADLDQDGDNDHSDFGLFQRCYSGQNNPLDTNCVNS